MVTLRVGPLDQGKKKIHRKMDQDLLKKIWDFLQLNNHLWRSMEIWLHSQVRDHLVIFTALGVCMELVNLSFCTWSGTQASAHSCKENTLSCFTGMQVIK